MYFIQICVIPVAAIVVVFLMVGFLKYIMAGMRDEAFQNGVLSGCENSLCGSSVIPLIGQVTWLCVQLSLPSCQAYPS